MTPRRIFRAVAEVIILALLICAWALIVDHRCSVALDASDITWEELAAQSAQSNGGGGR